MKVLVCEKCGRIYSFEFSGLRCEKRNCNGKLIVIEMKEEDEKT